MVLSSFFFMCHWHDGIRIHHGCIPVDPSVHCNIWKFVTTVTVHRWRSTAFGLTWENSGPAASVYHRSVRTWCSSYKLGLWWVYIPVCCTSWVYLVWEFFHRGCLASQLSRPHWHSTCPAAADHHHNSQSTPSSRRSSSGCRASDCMALCCWASPWRYSDEALDSTPDAPSYLYHSSLNKAPTVMWSSSDRICEGRSRCW